MTSRWSNSWTRGTSRSSIPAPAGEPKIQDTMTASSAQLRRVALSALLGTTIEFYDFLLYGTMAALVFNKLFFPSASPVVGTLAAFGTMAAGYIARPLGGVILGHFGDRFGRKSVLTWTMITMGVGSFLIGILPTYRTIGIWAPILLLILSLVQGIAAGGEWGGSALMVVEHASRRRGFWSSSVQVGASAGSLVSKIAVSLVVLLPSEQLLAWGWRIPFLISILLCGVGLFVRLAVAESPLFEQAQSEKTTVRSPLLTVLRRPRAPILACGAGLATFVVLAFGHTYGVAYALGLGYDESTVVWTVTTSALVVLLATPVFALLSDHVGRKPVIAYAAGSGVLLAYPILWLINIRSTSGLVVGMILAALLQAATYGPLAALLTEMFGTNVRYTGASIGYQVAAMLGGGFTPLIASALQHLGGGSNWVSAFLAMCFAITLAAALLIGETSRRDLSDGQPRP
jgi:MHS family shikimate/dehydroshikimate transporter-like MFS transporter